MAKPKSPSVRRIAAEIQPITRSAKRATTLPAKFWMDEYLQAVYRLFCQWREKKICKKCARRLARQYDLKFEKRTHPIRVLIAHTCPTDDQKIQSRWTRALEYAASENVLPAKLSKFTRRNGGISGCARAIAEISPKRKSPSGLAVDEMRKSLIWRTGPLIEGLHSARNLLIYSSPYWLCLQLSH